MLLSNFAEAGKSCIVVGFGQVNLFMRVQYCKFLDFSRDVVLGMEQTNTSNCDVD